MAPPERVGSTYVLRRKASLGVLLVLAIALWVLCAIAPSLAYAYDVKHHEYDDASSNAARVIRVIDVSADLAFPADAVGVDQISDVADFSVYTYATNTVGAVSDDALAYATRVEKRITYSCRSTTSMRWSRSLEVVRPLWSRC